MNTLLPESIEIMLGGGTYKVKPLKWKRLIPMKRALSELLYEIDKGTNFAALFNELAKPNPNVDTVISAFGTAFDAIMEKIPPVLKLAIPNLDESIFLIGASDETSPDVIQVWNAFGAILDANHLQMLKNLLGGATNVPTTPSSPSSATGSDTSPAKS